MTLLEEFNSVETTPKGLTLTKGENVFIDFMSDKYVITKNNITSTNLNVDDLEEYLYKVLELCD